MPISPTFPLSIVSPVFNVAPYLRDFLRSVERQDIGFRRNVQLVLVDDGSTDGSGAICDAFARRHPGNVAVLHQSNAGQAAARKAGLALATGRVVNFCDPDDILSRNACRKALAMLDAHPDVDLAALPIFFFGSRRGPHPLNAKFAQGARVVDLESEWTSIQLSLPASFVRRSALASFDADPALVVAEDAKETMRLLIANPKVALVPSARYLYRKHAASTLATSNARRESFLPVLERFSEWAAAESVRRHGRILPFVQHALLYDLSWKVLRLSSSPLSPEERAAFRDRALALLRRFDDESILLHDRLNAFQKSFLLARKREAPPRLAADPATGELFLETSDGLRLPCPVARCTVFKLGEEDGAFRVHAGLKTPAFGSLPPAELIARCNGEETVFARTGIRPDDTFADSPVACAFTAAARIPVPAASFAVSFAVRFAGFPAAPVEVSWADFAPLTHRIPHSFFTSRGAIVRPTPTGFRADRGGPLPRLLAELRFDISLLRRPAWGERALVAFRWIRIVLGPFAPRRVWLVTDRPDRADDCGAALFEHLMAHRKELGVRPRFVLHPSSPDWKRMRALGPVVPFTPVRYRLASLFADWTLSSQFNESTRFPFQGRQHCVGDLMRKHRFAFLEHGVADKGLAGFCDRAKRDLSLVVASSPFERDAILADARCGYSPDEVVLTGLPRFDGMEDRREKAVVFMPTWRRQLVKETDPETLRRTLVDGFETTPYVTAIRETLSDPSLLAAASRLGYRLQFRPHPEFMASRDRFGLPPEIEMLGPETDIRDVFARGALCVTDWSSAVFDFAWLGKPVVYYRPEGAGLDGHFDRPWFDAERDGFGPVVHAREELVRTLTGLMERGCPLEEPYRSRVDAFFPFRDRNNCRRVVDAVLAAERR
jgi:glycosyltransferase involved in cell wall biosynthesis